MTRLQRLAQAVQHQGKQAQKLCTAQRSLQQRLSQLPSALAVRLALTALQAEQD
jgi:hypothetical protein